MSASPADRTPGRTPNGVMQPMMRRPKQADPLRRPKDKKKLSKRPPTTNGAVNPRPNGVTVSGQIQIKSMPQHPGRPAQLHQLAPGIQDGSAAISGFSSAPVAPIRDYPLVISKKALLEGLRHHVSRFSSKKTVDPRNPDEFVRPVRLHRRDPRAPAFAGGEEKNTETEKAGDAALEDKERVKQEMVRAERDAQREAEMAQVAPSANTGGPKRPNSFKKKTQQIFRNDQTEEQKAESKLRYEEALPWHLEDFEGKQVWVGSYEAALSDTYAILAQGPDGKFRMTPLHKWYKFTPKNHFKTLTIEEAESRMSKKTKEPRWFMESQQANKEKENEQENKKAAKGLFLGKWERGAGGSGLSAPKSKQEQADADDLDFEEDRFADDEENVLFEGEDEEAKEAEDRIKRDQLQANIFDLKEEKEYDKAEQEEKKEKDAEKKLGKGVKKALMKREKNYIYDTDSADNPYTEESESDDTETERLKEEERKKEEEKKPIPSDPEKGKPTISPHSSGNSTKDAKAVSSGLGTHPDRKSVPSNALKRSGSPNLSEASGTETPRKKHKKQQLTPSQPQIINAPSRPTSPPLPQPSSSTPTSEPIRSTLANSRKSSAAAIPADALKPSNSRADGKRPRSYAGSGSERDTAGSGGEKSDGARKKLMLKFSKSGNKNPTPLTSRAGSPDPRSGDAAGKGIALVGNASLGSALVGNASLGNAPVGNSSVGNAPVGIASTGQAPVGPVITTDRFPTAEELRAHIPPEGIKVGDLLGHFKGQVVGEDRKRRFTELMRGNSTYDRASKLLKPLTDE